MALKSVLYKKEKRLNDAVAAYNKFKKNYPESEKMKELDGLFGNLNKEIKQTKELVQNIKLTNTNNNGL